jgi:nicotinamidase/pyrazinamidase
LAGYLREHGIRSVYVCGLARDVCVKWTAEDGVAAGFETFLLWDLSQPVVPDSDSQVRSNLAQADVRIMLEEELLCAA